MGPLEAEYITMAACAYCCMVAYIGYRVSSDLIRAKDTPTFRSLVIVAGTFLAVIFAISCVFLGATIGAIWILEEESEAKMSSNMDQRS
jgi:small basic protein